MKVLGGYSGIRVGFAGNRELFWRSGEMNGRGCDAFQPELRLLSINTPILFFPIIIDNNYLAVTIARKYFQVKLKGQIVVKERSSFINLILNLSTGALAQAVFMFISWSLGKLTTKLGADGSQLFESICDWLSNFMLFIGTVLVVIFVFVTSLQFLLELYRSFMESLRRNKGETQEKEQQEKEQQDEEQQDEGQ